MYYLSARVVPDSKSNAYMSSSCCGGLLLFSFVSSKLFRAWCIRCESGDTSEAHEGQDVLEMAFELQPDIDDE